MLNSLFQASDSKSVSRRAVLLVILAVAAFFRLYRLEAIPPGLTHDEAHLNGAARIVTNKPTWALEHGNVRRPLKD